MGNHTQSHTPLHSADFGHEIQRLFRHHKLLKKSNLRRLGIRLARFKRMVATGQLTRESLQQRMAGWEGYAKMGNTFALRQKVQETIESIGVNG
jgi:hypothetical protein